jgi:biotin carboxyl carrier protein
MMRWWVSRDGHAVEVAVRRVGETFEVRIDGATYRVELLPVRAGLFALLGEDGRNYAVASQRLARNHWRVSLAQRYFEVRLRDLLDREVSGEALAHVGPHEVRAPIPGRVVSVSVAPGAAVKPGQPLLVMEAMKMENQICAEAAGTVERVLVTTGATVEGGQVLVVVA